jgi:plastocyanin
VIKFGINEFAAKSSGRNCNSLALTDTARPLHRREPTKEKAAMNWRRTQMLVTAIGVLVMGAMEMNIPSIADTPDATKIIVKDFMFNPTPLTVKAGSTVTWTNMDDEPHTVVSDAGVFKSGGMDTNESFSFKFDKPGTYHFTCSIHPRMVGSVVVQ